MKLAKSSDKPEQNQVGKTFWDFVVDGPDRRSLLVVVVPILAVAIVLLLAGYQVFWLGQPLLSLQSTPRQPPRTELFQFVVDMDKDSQFVAGPITGEKRSLRKTILNSGMLFGERSECIRTR